MECLEEAELLYHSIECPIIDCLMEWQIETALMSLRTIFKGVHAFGSLTKIGVFLEQHGKTKVDAFSNAAHGRYENNDQRKFHEVND